jgi:hypothetical protein
MRVIAIAAVAATGGCRQLLDIDDLPRPGNEIDAPADPPDPDAAVDADPADAAPDAPPPIDARFCGGNYVQLVIGGLPSASTYRLRGNTSWSNARDNCIDDGAHLVILDNIDEAEAIVALVDVEGDVSPYYSIGLYDPATPVDNDFVTVLGGAPPYTPWGAGQPSGGSEDCVLAEDGLLPPYPIYDWPCNSGSYKSVCECPP